MAAPSLFTLFATAYRYLAPSHLIIFLLSGLGFIVFGRKMKKQGRKPFWPGVIIGAVTAFLASLAYQYTIRLPQAQYALSLTLHGVPSSAIWAMLHIHPLSATMVISSFMAVFYGLWGGFAAWWGGLKTPISHPQDTVHAETRS